MSHSHLEFLRHILDEGAFLAHECTGLTREVFLQNESLKRAFVRSLEVIGEAVKNVPENVRVQSSEIQWKAIAGMRDRLIHGYFSVDYDIVWDAVTNKVPTLVEQISKILADAED